VNELIKIAAELDISFQLPTVFAFLSFIPVVILCFWYGKKTNIGVFKSIVFVAFTYVVNFALMLLLAWVEANFQYFGSQNGIRSFAYTPLLCYIGAKLFRMKWREGNALFALCLPFSHAVAHLGCIFPGCCEGYPCEWGIYNAYAGEYLFPIQLVESAVAVLIGIYVAYRAKKNHFEIDGKEYPIMMLLFGSTRFLCEFLRANDKIWLGCSSLSFHALFMFAVGTIWLIMLNKKR